MSLFVVLPVAWTIAFIIMSIVSRNCFLFYHGQNNRSILEEKPIGRLGTAALLHGSDVASLVSDTEIQSKAQTKIRETVKRMAGMVESRCWYEKDSKKIRLTGQGWEHLTRPMKSQFVASQRTDGSAGPRAPSEGRLMDSQGTEQVKHNGQDVCE